MSKSQRATQRIINLIQGGHLFEAEREARQLLSNHQDEAFYYLGIIALAQGKTDDSLKWYQDAIARLPHRADVAYNHGVALQSCGHLDHAANEWRRAITLNPRYEDAYFNLAIFFTQKGAAEDAEDMYRKLLAINPLHKQATYNLGNLLYRTGRFVDAEALYLQLLQAFPAYAPGWVNLSMVLTKQGRYADAEKALRHVLSFDPHNIEAHWNLSHLLLRSHRWPEAWREYEWRRARKAFPRAPLRVPDWDGHHEPARRLLLYNDQGLGDGVQFLRYATLLAEQGHTVWLLVQKELKNIAATVPGIAGVVGPGDALPVVDAQAPLLSLPYLLSLNDSSPYWSGPYLFPRSKMELPRSGNKMAIGLAWAGNPNNPTDASRSISLRELKPIMTVPGIDWFSIQVGSPAAQIKDEGLSGHIHDLAPRLADYTDTAAAIAALDLVIAVDTSVLHVVGAIGRPVWGMLSPAHDWRWAGDSGASPWYPSLRLFRQKIPGDWQGVVNMITDELTKSAQTLNTKEA